jgi:hypothetical protein
VANTVSHELGHVLAYIYARDGILADNTTFGVTDASSTQLWQHTGAKDITYLNDQYPCYDYNFNENGLFTWMTDLLGNEFCTDGGTGSIRTQPGFVGPGDPGDGATLDSTTSINLPPPSTSTTTYAAAASAAVGNGAGPNGNLGVLALNQPNIFGKHNGDGTFDSYAIAREIFAETFANVSGNPTPLNYMNTFDLGGSWGPCSQDIGFDLFYGGSYAYWISSPQTIYYFPNVDSTNWSTLTCPAN